MSSERSIRFTNRSIENKTDNSISRRLTLKQRLFVDEYISNGGNGTRAVIAAGSPPLKILSGASPQRT